MSSLLTTFSGLLTPVIAILGGYIAYRQWLTAHMRLKLDLFEKRLAIHKAAADLIGSIITTGQVDMGKVVAFKYGTRQTRWLLSEETERYFDEMYNKAIDLHTFMSPDQALERNEREIKDWFFSQPTALDAKFDRFLKIPA